jgi:hypothetical protein
MIQKKTSRYFTQNPKHLFQNGFNLPHELRRSVLSFREILKYAILPFQYSSEKPEDPPQPDPKTLDSITIERCEGLFHQIEQSREQLEQKARATFTTITFLAPLLASAAVYVLQLGDAAKPASAWLYLPAIAALLLAFCSIMRAVTVRPREVPFLELFLDGENGLFRPRDDSRYVQCLLYCSSFNFMSNQHIAQLIKGGQILTSIAVLLFVAAIIPEASTLKTSPTKTEIVQPVKIADSDSDVIVQQLARVADAIASRSDLIRGQPEIELRTRIEELERNAQIDASRAKHEPTRKGRGKGQPR